MFSTIWNNVIYYPILNLLIVFYDLLFDNLGLAIIVIAILIRLILIPLMKNQTEMTKKMSSLKPQLDELQKKYKNNPEKLSQEQIKLYKKVGYNPLGCLVTFIPQLIILSVLIQVIRNVKQEIKWNISFCYKFTK
jgi:YidC/Oxa1 family membrane protein insertase